MKTKHIKKMVSYCMQTYNMNPDPKKIDIINKYKSYLKDDFENNCLNLWLFFVVRRDSHNELNNELLRRALLGANYYEELIGQIDITGVENIHLTTFSIEYLANGQNIQRLIDCFEGRMKLSSQIMKERAKEVYESLTQKNETIKKNKIFFGKPVIRLLCQEGLSE